MILSILKVLGIVFLIIVAVLIIILGIVLFVPIRYRFAGEYKEVLDAEVQVKWSPVLLKLIATYQNNKMKYILKLFGGVVMTNQDIELSWIGRRFFSSKEKIEEKNFSADTAYMENDDLLENVKRNDVKQRNGTETIVQEDDAKEIANQKIEKSKMQPLIRLKQSNKKKKQSFFHKIRQTINNIKKRIQYWIEKLKKINKKKEALLKVYHSKRFEIAKKDVVLYVNRLVYIIKPQKVEGYVRFGLEDPAATGQLLGGIAMFISLYDSFLKIYPDFEQACIEIDVKGNGRIYLFSVVKLMLKIILNKNLIKIIKKVQTIIEA